MSKKEIIRDSESDKCIGEEIFRYMVGCGKNKGIK